MFVYGIRCAPADLSDLPSDAEADYYMDFGLLVFPAYTRPTCVNSHGRLTDAFWSLTKRIVESPERVRAVTLEHPWLTEGEHAVLYALQDYYPSLNTDWYHVPQAIVHAADEGPHLSMEEVD